MLVPYNTDAPVYHFPFATIGLILANIGVVVFESQADPSEIQRYILQFGHGLHPLQWVTSIFLHGSESHLIGNMVFLWTFGLVVEGKLGWWRFLLLYLVIGAVEGAIEQVVMLGSRGGPTGALGASGVIFGLLAISLVWAPENDIKFCLWFIIPLWTFEWPITVVAGFYFGFEFLFAWFAGFSMSTPVLHLIGAAVGAVFGVLLLKLGWVDCEGWDLFHLYKGTLGEQSDKKEEPEAAKPVRVLPQHAQLIAATIDKHLEAGDVAGAVGYYKKQREVHSGWDLSPRELLALIQAAHKQKLWADSVPPMFDYLRQCPHDSARIQLRLAQVLLDVVREPAKASILLSSIPATELPPRLGDVRMQLIDRAAQGRIDPNFNFADDD